MPALDGFVQSTLPEIQDPVPDWSKVFRSLPPIQIRITAPLGVNPPGHALTEGESHTHIQLSWLQMSPAPALDAHPGSWREGEELGRGELPFPACCQQGVHGASQICRNHLWPCSCSDLLPLQDPPDWPLQSGHYWCLIQHKSGHRFDFGKRAEPVTWSNKDIFGMWDNTFINMVINKTSVTVILFNNKCFYINI